MAIPTRARLKWTNATELVPAQMLTEMAAMSIEDGMVMQIHPGACRNHNAQLHASHGRDKGADIPMRTDYVQALKPLLGKYGNDPRLSIILFTLDGSSYARELAPLVAEERLANWEAAELAVDLTYNFVRKAYKLDTIPSQAGQAA